MFVVRVVSAHFVRYSLTPSRYISKGPRRTGRGRQNTGFFAVDRSELFNAPLNLGTLPESPNREPLTPLAKELLSLIQARGPLSLHDYMAMCLHHSKYGYYHSAQDKIGDRGDFVTAPELSHLFGETLAIWVYSVFEALKRPKKVYLVELGPGLGTLMQDMLRVLARLPAFADSVHVVLVEASQSLRRQQLQALGCAEDIKEHDKVEDGRTYTAHIRPSRASSATIRVPVTFRTYFTQLPAEGGDAAVPLIVLGQEFLDTFPVHQFVRTREGLWREKLVDMDASSSGKLAFRLVLARQPTPALSLLQPERGFLPIADAAGKEHPAAKASSVEHKDKVTGKNKDTDDDNDKQKDKEEEKGDGQGQGLEVSPLQVSTCLSIAARISAAGGACLLVDYGPDLREAPAAVVEDSLRAFHRHTQVSPLSSPGQCDLTADVNFPRILHILQRRNPQIACLPLVTQGQFLMGLGIGERVRRLMEKDSTSTEEAEQLLAALKLLVGGEPGMGEAFKVMCLAHPDVAPHIAGFPSTDEA